MGYFLSTQIHLQHILLIESKRLTLKKVIIYNKLQLCCFINSNQQLIYFTQINLTNVIIETSLNHYKQKHPTVLNLAKDLI